MAHRTSTTPNSRRANRHRRAVSSHSGAARSPVAIFAALTAVLLLGVAGVWASHGSSFIDVTDNDDLVQHNGAVFTQGGLGAGTGNFDPYLTLSPGGNVPTEQGYNFCDDGDHGTPGDPSDDCPSAQFDEQAGGGRTHELLASAIPVTEFNGTDYRQFFLDSNDSGSDPFMSVDTIKIFLDTQDNLTDYDPATETFDNDTGTAADKIWDLDETSGGADDDVAILMNTQGLESGSGVSDMSVLVPDSLFPAECAYGSTECELFVIFYTEAGNVGTDGPDDENYDTTAGFEEWKIENRPVVNVTKTIESSFTRSFPWTIAKEADGDPDHIDIFAGDTASIDWTVTATVGTPTDSDPEISGSITIFNPTGASPIETEIPAEIGSVEDVLTQGALDTGFTVDCPEDFPFVVDAGDSVVCTYSGTSTSTDDGTNTATVTLNLRDKHDNLIGTADYEGTADFDSADASVTLIDECIVVTDDNATPGDTSDDVTLDSSLCYNESPGSYPLQTTVGPYDVADCDTDSITNTARFETIDDANDTTQNGSASDTVTVTCYELTVTKDATESLIRTYPWDIAKEADGEPDHIDVFAGQTASIDWSVTATVGAPVDSGWAVTGTITLTNPAPMDAEDVDVSDVISHTSLADVNATVDCGDGADDTVVDVPANDDATCSYSATLGNGDDRTNTATAELFGEEYTGTADVDFDGATTALVDECIVVTDDNATPGDATDDTTLDSDLCFDESPGEYDLSTDVGPYAVADCDTDSITNTAAFETADDTNDTDASGSADDTVTVTCYELTVTKDADETFDRDYDWDISKTRVIVDGEIDGDGDPATLTLDENEPYTLHYEVEVSVSGFTDANHAVSGTITIANPAPIAADDVVVSDVISHAVDADILPTLDCGEGAGDDDVDIPAQDSATCEYSADLPNADDRTNTATATLFDVDYTGTADIDFAGADVTEIDECVDVTDNSGTADTSDDVLLGTVCAADAPHTFEFSIEIEGFAECGTFEFTNVATFVVVDDENDTGETESATYTVVIDVPCPEGCTLTWGYWKTHNESFAGGAPPDPTWDLLLPSGEDSPFFLSGQTYFEVLWTAPQGNVYYNLAHQYIAAILNQLDGAAVPPAVQTAINQATTLFNTYTDEQAAAWKGKVGKVQRAQFIALAGILASYNEGAIGPGHCDEPAPATLVPFLPIGALPVAAVLRRLRRG